MKIEWHNPVIKSIRNAVDTLVSLYPFDNTPPVKVLDSRSYPQSYSNPVIPVMVEYQGIRLSPIEARQVADCLMEAAKLAEQVLSDHITTHGEYAMDGSEQYITYAKQGNTIIWSSGWTTRSEAIRRLIAFKDMFYHVNLASSKGQDNG